MEIGHWRYNTITRNKDKLMEPSSWSYLLELLDDDDELELLLDDELDDDDELDELEELDELDELEELVKDENWLLKA